MEDKLLNGRQQSQQHKEKEWGGVCVNDQIKE